MSPVLRKDVAALFLLAALAARPAEARAQDPVAGPPRPALHVTDSRLAAALSRLVAGSPSAAHALSALAESGLPVAVGRPVDLAAVAPEDGGPEQLERMALLSEADGGAGAADGAFAWVVFRVAPRERVERAWVVVDVDRIDAAIRARRAQDADALVESVLTVALAHELVAHVGSVARSRSLADFCDDPAPGTGRRDAQACSLQVENRVRRELNRSLGLKGARRLPERQSYALDVMNFAWADASR